MTRSRSSLDLPSPTPINLHQLKATKAMRNSLNKLHSCLLCTLCNQTFRNPVTLPACGHSFCQHCINEYACNSYECPSCALPITLRGGRIGKFDQTNPQIETVTTCFVNLCQALNSAPDLWWRLDSPTVPEESLIVLQPGENDEQFCFVMPQGDDDENLGHVNNLDDTKIETYSDQQQMEHLDDKEDENMDDYNEEDQEEDGDDNTELFPSPGSVGSHRSCPIPSQSPGCSMIAPESSQLSFSQEENRTLKPNNDFVSESILEKENTCVEKQRLGNQPSLPEKTRVVIASKLSPNDRNILIDLEKQGVIMIVESCVDSFVVAVCGNAELETGDGWLVGMTYHFLYALAMGAQVMYTSYFHKLPLSNHDNKNRVIGIGKSMDWMGPQRAVEARMVGRSLLTGYTLIIVGTFDALSQSRRADQNEQYTIYSKERIETLLTLCGAKSINFSDLPQEVKMCEASDKVAFLIRPNPRSRDWKVACKLVQSASLNDKPIICANWVLDSIADFRCKKMDPYSLNNFK